MGVLIWPRGNWDRGLRFVPCCPMRCYLSDRGALVTPIHLRAHFADPRGITICTFCYGRPDTDWNHPHQYKARLGFVRPGGSFVYDCSRLRRLPLLLLPSCPAGSLSGCYSFPSRSGHLSLRCCRPAFAFVDFLAQRAFCATLILRRAAAERGRLAGELAPLLLTARRA
jgi:hypothetical protein